MILDISRETGELTIIQPPTEADRQRWREAQAKAAHDYTLELCMQRLGAPGWAATPDLKGAS